MVQQEMRDVFLPALTGVQHEGEAVPPPTALDWYPHGLGWQIDVKKSVLRKEEQFKKFQQWLVHETLTVSGASGWHRQSSSAVEEIRGRRERSSGTVAR
jgi:SRSO17 transposase